MVLNQCALILISHNQGTVEATVRANHTINKGCPNRIFINIFFAFFNSQRMIVHFTADLTHFISEYCPETNRQGSPDGKKSRIQKSFFSIQDRIFCNHCFIKPFINKSFMSQHQAHQDHKSNQHRLRIRMLKLLQLLAGKSYCKPAHAKSSSAKKEHGCIYNQQKINAVL